MSDKEKYYDDVIAPLLSKVASECKDVGMSLTAVVEYDKGHRGRTRLLQPDASLEMVMVDHCAKTAPNVDGYIIGLIKYCRAKDIPMGASFVLNDFANKGGDPQ